MTHVFRDNLLERGSHDLPREYLDVFFYVSRLGTRKTHDELEKVLIPRFILRHSNRSEALEVTTDPILLLHREASTNQRLEQVDRIHRSKVTRVRVLTEDA